MDLTEFREEGYLQEVNRRFFHPLGLALGVSVRPVEEPRLVVFDSRDDPEGVYFAKMSLAAKAANIDRLWVERQSARMAALGWMVQPADSDPEQADG
jgi:hypothetical protein